MSKRIVSIIISLFALCNFNYGQINSEEGVPAEYYNYLLGKAMEKKTMKDSLYKINRTISLSVHFVLPDSNTLADFEIGVAKCNKYFEPIGIKFKHCITDTILNTNYKKIESDVNESQILIKNYTPNTLNIYVTEEINLKGEGVVAGYAYYPDDNRLNDIIVLIKSSLTDITLTHEMGHIFGLMHPHDSIKPGFANDSLCNTTGDLLCDTPAEPKLLGLVSADCEYTGNLKDLKGDYFVPKVTNIMSYTINSCRCEFTFQQYIRMKDSYYQFLQYLK